MKEIQFFVFRESGFQLWGRETIRAFLPKRGMARGLHISTNLSSLVVTLLGLCRESHLKTTLLQALAVHQLRRAAASGSSVPYSAGD